MSDEQREVSFEEALINRLAQRVGVLTAQIEALQIQLEMAQQQPEPEMNGDIEEQVQKWQSSAAS